MMLKYIVNPTHRDLISFPIPCFRFIYSTPARVTWAQICLAKGNRVGIFAATRRCQAHKAAINQREKSNFHVAANISRCLRLFIEGVSFFWPAANAVSGGRIDGRRLAARHITRQRITEAYRWQLITPDAPFTSCWFPRGFFDAVSGQQFSATRFCYTQMMYRSICSCTDREVN